MRTFGPILGNESSRWIQPIRCCMHTGDTPLDDAPRQTVLRKAVVRFTNAVRTLDHLAPQIYDLAPRVYSQTGPSVVDYRR